MPTLLRKIKTNRWQPYLEYQCEWLAEGDVPADPVTDLKTQDNQLSVWQVGEDQSLRARVAAAMTVGGGSLQNFDYLLVDSRLITETEIEWDHSPGATKDQALNETHVNLKNLSGQKLVRLTEKILEASTVAHVGRANPKEVARYILDAVSRKWLAPADIPAGIAEKVKKYFPDEWRPLDARISD